MSYRSILVQIDIDDPSRRHIELARQLARSFEASLIGFCACDTYTPSAVASEGGFEAQFYTHQMDDIGRRLGNARTIFEQIAGDGENASWRGLTGDPTLLLATHARSSDLIVCSTDTHDVLADGYRSVDIGSLLLSAGRPVFLPGNGQETTQMERVMVCWRDTREARRALSDSLPFLKRASNVLLTTVEEDDRDRQEEGLKDVERYLTGHDIAAETRIVPNSGSVGVSLANAARETQADLVVAGAFGHSRLREWVFGGVTRSLIADTSVHRLFSN
ncbi:universal stress protein [Roseibium sp.]|uniref:universal stress protein n=1 Tax=Roseibium sp. TaxID=1936156 RepID=UPI003D106AC4